MTYVGSMFADKPPRPVDLIPPQYRPQEAAAVPRTEAERQRRNERTWKAFDAYFAQPAKDRK